MGRVLGDVGCVECGAWPSPRSTLYIHTPTHQPPHSTLHRPHSTLQTPLYSAHMGSCFGVFAVRTQKKALSSTLLCDIVQQMENCFFRECKARCSVRNFCMFPPDNTIFAASCTRQRAPQVMVFLGVVAFVLV